MKYLLVGLVLVALYIVMSRRQGADKVPEPLWIGMVGVRERQTKPSHRKVRFP